MLKPTKSDVVVKKTAEDLGISEEKAKAVVDLFYSTLKDKIEDMSHPRYNLPGLGVMYFGMKKLYGRMMHLEKMLASDDPEDFKKLSKFKLDFKMLEFLKKKFNLFNDEYKLNGKNIKYVKEEKSTSDLEKS